MWMLYLGLAGAQVGKLFRQRGGQKMKSPQQRASKTLRVVCYFAGTDASALATGSALVVFA